METAGSDHICSPGGAKPAGCENHPNKDFWICLIKSER